MSGRAASLTRWIVAYDSRLPVNGIPCGEKRTERVLCNAVWVEIIGVLLVVLAAEAVVVLVEVVTGGGEGGGGGGVVAVAEVAVAAVVAAAAVVVVAVMVASILPLIGGVRWRGGVGASVDRVSSVAAVSVMMDCADRRVSEGEPGIMGSKVSSDGSVIVVLLLLLLFLLSDPGEWCPAEAAGELVGDLSDSGVRGGVVRYGKTSISVRDDRLVLFRNDLNVIPTAAWTPVRSRRCGIYATVTSPGSPPGTKGRSGIRVTASRSVPHPL